jgi:hypothetical protein
MMPILQAGFYAIVDRTQRQPAALAGGLVAVWLRGELRVRWLEQDGARGKLTLRAENPVYPAVALQEAGANSLLGKVVFYWGTPS